MSVTCMSVSACQSVHVSHVYVSQCMSVSACQSVHVCQCMSVSACQSRVCQLLHVSQCMSVSACQSRVCQSLHVSHCMSVSACQSVHVSQCMSVSACQSVHVSHVYVSQCCSVRVLHFSDQVSVLVLWLSWNYLCYYIIILLVFTLISQPLDSHQDFETLSEILFLLSLSSECLVTNRRCVVL